MTRRGGRVAAMDCDWATLTVDIPDLRLGQRVVSELQRLVASPYVGRQLPRLFRSAEVDEESSKPML